MTPYFGLPITPASACLAAIKGAHAFVSFRHSDQLGIAIEYCQSFAVDNGAFSAWRSGSPVTDWQPYFDFVAELLPVPNFDFAVVPDVIGGSDGANDELLSRWPHPKFMSAPVWHLNAGLDRLERLVQEWPRICLGSAGEFSAVGDAKWWTRINEAMEVICDDRGRPKCKVHGLRMLDPDVFTRLPLASADSTSIGRNVNIDVKWAGNYSPTSRDLRATVLRQRVEAFNASRVWQPQMAQKSIIFMDAA